MLLFTCLIKAYTLLYFHLSYGCLDTSIVLIDPLMHGNFLWPESITYYLRT